MKRIYLDHAATSPMPPPVAEAMEPWLRERFGNPSSLYQEGRQAKDEIDRAREGLSDALGCLFGEVLFTSCGTEAANMALIGAALANQDPSRNRILLGAAEHHCVLHTAPMLQNLGYQVDLIPVDRNAWINPESIVDLINDTVLLVAVMHANNEVGTINPVDQLVPTAHQAGSLFFCDAVQTFGTVPFKAKELGPDMMSFSAHKIGGPKGAGALYLRSGVKINPLIVGGGQEREMRAGTENVAAIAGFAAAVAKPQNPEAKRTARDAFLSKLRDLRDDWGSTVSTGTETLPGHAHLRFPGITAESLLILLDRMGISASSGAACSSGSLEPSHVLLACGYSQSEAEEGLRFTFGRGNSVDEAEMAAVIVAEAADQIRRSAK